MESYEGRLGLGPTYGNPRMAILKRLTPQCGRWVYGLLFLPAPVIEGWLLPPLPLPDLGAGCIPTCANVAAGDGAAIAGLGDSVAAAIGVDEEALPISATLLSVNSEYVVALIFVVDGVGADVEWAGGVSKEAFGELAAGITALSSSTVLGAAVGDALTVSSVLVAETMSGASLSFLDEPIVSTLMS